MQVRSRVLRLRVRHTMAHLSTGAPLSLGHRLAPSGRSSFATASRLRPATRQRHTERRRGPPAPCAASPSPGEAWSRALSEGAARARQFFKPQRQPQPQQQTEDTSPSKIGANVEPAAASAAAADLSSSSSASGGVGGGSDVSAELEALIQSDDAEEEHSPEDVEWQEWKGVRFCFCIKMPSCLNSSWDMLGWHFIPRKISGGRGFANAEPDMDINVPDINSSTPFQIRISALELTDRRWQR